MKKLLSVLLALTLIFAFASTAMAATTVEYADGASQVVYVYQNDTLTVTFNGSAAKGIEVTAKDGVEVPDANGNKVTFTDVSTTGDVTVTAYYDGVGSTSFSFTVKTIAEPTVLWKTSELTKHTGTEVNKKTVPVGEFTLGIYDDGKYVPATFTAGATIADGAVNATVAATSTRVNFTYGGNTYIVDLTRQADTNVGLNAVKINGQTYTSSSDLVTVNGKVWTIVLPHDFDVEDWNVDKEGVPASSKATPAIKDAGLFTEKGTSTFVVTVTAEDTTKTQDYTINCKLASDDTSLKSLTIGGVPVDLTKADLTVALDTTTFAELTSADVVVATTVNGLVYKVSVPALANNTDTERNVGIRVFAENCEENAHSAVYNITCTIGYNAGVKSVAINDAAAAPFSAGFTGTVLNEATSAKIVVTPAVYADVTSVKVFLGATNKTATKDAAAGTYTATFDSFTANEVNGTIVVTAKGDTVAEYPIRITRGAAIVPAYSLSGLSTTGTNTVDATSKTYSYTATAVTVDSATLALKTGTTPSSTKATLNTTTEKIALAGMVDGKEYVLTVKYTPAGGTQQTATYAIKAVFAIPAFDEFFVSTNTSGTKVEDFTSDYTAGTTKYELKDDFEVEALSELDNLYFQYDMASGFSIKSVTLNGKTCSKKSGYYTLDAKNMEFGTNEVKIKVEDRDDKTTTYTIEFTVKADIPEEVQIKDVDFKTKKTTGSGSNISSSKCDISPSFDALTLEYDVVLDEEYAKDTLYIRVELEDKDAKIKASGAKEVDDDDEIYVYSFEAPEEGKNLTVTFTVEEGRDEAKYVFNISTGADADAAQLKGLIIAENDDEDDAYKTITPNFAPGQYDYYVVLDGDDSKSDVYFQFELDDEDDDIEITVDGDVEDEWSYDEDEWYDFEIARGEKVEVKVVITDNKDDDIENTYTITVVKGDDEDDDEVDMTGIKLNTKSSGTSSTNVALDKTFAEKTKSYSATVASSVKKIYVAPSYKDSELVLVNGKEVSKSGKYVEVELVEGKNVIEVVAYAENLDDSLTYTITVTRGGVEDMSYLAVVSGSQTLSLSPAFDKDVHNYAAIADNSQSGVYFSAYAGTDAKITVTQSVTGTVVATKTISSSSYSTSGTFTLYTGINVFTVTVSNDSEAEIYYVSVYKQPTALNITKSEQKVSVDGGTAKTLYAYNINGNNFIKIRDLAVLLNGSDKQFGISYNTATTTITLTSGNKYTAQAGDNTALPAYKSGAVVSTQPFYLDGSKIVPMAYNIGGNNYLMIRDLAVFLDFAVSYNSTYNRIDIDTDASYNPTK